MADHLSENAMKVFEELKIRRKHRYLVFKMGAESVDIEKIGGRKETYQQFRASLPYSDCRFAIFDHEFKTADGRLSSKLWFVSWFPNSSMTHVKMAYASVKGKLRERVIGVFDTQVGSLEELDSNLGLGEEDAEEEDKDFDF